MSKFKCSHMEHIAKIQQKFGPSLSGCEVALEMLQCAMTLICEQSGECSDRAKSLIENFGKSIGKSLSPALCPSSASICESCASLKARLVEMETPPDSPRLRSHL